MQLCGSLCHHSDTLSCICFKSQTFCFVIIPAITPAIYSITAYPSLQFPNFHWPQTFLFSNVEKCVADFIAIMEPRRKSSIGKQSCLLCFSMETPYFLQILSVLLLFALRWTHSPMLLPTPPPPPPPPHVSGHISAEQSTNDLHYRWSRTVHPRSDLLYRQIKTKI